MKPLVIYHASCADGFGAAFAAWLKLGDDAEYVPMQYLDSKLNAVEAWEALSAAIPSKANTGREVYILDFSLPKPVMDKLFAVSERVVWLDHHKTAFEMWCHGDFKKGDRFIDHARPHEKFILLDDNKSGALLAWEFFHPDTEVPLFIRHIDDYDRWQFKIDGTKAFNKAIWSHAPWSFKQWVEWFYDCKVGFTHKYWADFYTEGEAILRAHEQNVQSVVKGAARNCSIIPALINSADSYKAPWVWWNDPEYGDTCGANGLAANCPPNLSSDVGHELATQSGTFGLCWTFGKSGTMAKCQLRSNGEYDVSVIAKSFGGGGHRNAAGFEVDIQTLLGWLK